MGTPPYVSVKNVSLEYRLAKRAGSIFKPWQRSGAARAFPALVDVSFHLDTGDRLGIVGPNGSGKTTLMRVLAGVFPSSSGEVAHSGSMAFILDSGFGLDANLSGRTNAYTSGITRGLSRAVSRSLSDEIEAFAELGRFYGEPVRTYSMGMVARLIFAMSTASRPDILLMDEAIGAGDSSFQERARARVTEMMENSSILITASHSNEFLLNTCTKGLFLLDGKVAGMGGIEEVVAEYESWSDHGGKSRNQSSG